MKITFDSFKDVFRLQQVCLFARHGAERIQAMKELDEWRAEQMVQENEEWRRMEEVLSKAKPNIEIEL